MGVRTAIVLVLVVGCGKRSVVMDGDGEFLDRSCAEGLYFVCECRGQ